MRTNTKKHHIQPWAILIIAIVVVLLAAGSVYAFFVIKHPSSASTTGSSGTMQPSGVVNYSTPTQNQQDAGSTTKQQAPSQNSSDSQAQTLGVTIQLSLPRMTVILGTVTNTGGCTLTLTGPSSITYTSGIQAESDYSVCKGFDLSSLSSGSWHAMVDVQSGAQTGSASQSFTVK